MSQIQKGGVGHIAPPYTPGFEVVTFVWHSRHGHCYECGLPAAFKTGHYLEQPLPHNIPDEDKRCAVCAANHAADGETITRIENETHEQYEQAILRDGR